MTWPDGYFVAYAYDALNHMTTATESGGAVLATRTYDNLARPATIQYPSANDNMAYSWSSEDDLITLASNFAGAANDVAFTNTFTPAHQIAAATISNTAYKYLPPTSGSDVYGAANGLNQYTAMTPAGGSAQTLTYDTRGNLTGDGVLTLAYDPENRLMSATKAGMSAAYAYDPLGRRTTKTVNGAVTNFVHDSNTEIGEYDGAGTLIRRFIPGPVIDQPIAMVTASGTKSFFHTDKLGSVIAMSDATGHLAEGPYTYDAYGNCSASGAPCATGVPYRFTGQRLDPETGLSYYRARYYSSALGRFAQTDPIGYKDDINPYTYVHNDPTDATDPTGLYDCGPRTNCGLIQRFIAAGRRSLEHLDPDSDKAKKIASLLQYFGAPGDHNGVVFQDTHLSGRNAEAGANGVISVDLSKILRGAGRYGAANPTMSHDELVDAVGAIEIFHEGRHEQDEHNYWHGNQRPHRRDEKRTEVNAYTVDSDLQQGWKFNNALWNERMTPAQAAQAIDDYAEKSTQVWCSSGGTCP